METIKEVFLVFVIALVIGSMVNGWQQSGAGSATSSEGEASANTGPSLVSPVNESNFQSEVLQQQLPVLVNFYTENCPHCKRMAPILNQLANDYKGSLKVVRVDAMSNQSLAQRYEVGPVPAYVLIDHGQKVESFVGAMSKDRLISILKPHLKALIPTGKKRARPSVLGWHMGLQYR